MSEFLESSLEPLITTDNKYDNEKCPKFLDNDVSLCRTSKIKDLWDRTTSRLRAAFNPTMSFHEHCDRKFKSEQQRNKAYPQAVRSLSGPAAVVAAGRTVSNGVTSCYVSTSSNSRTFSGRPAASSARGDTHGKKSSLLFRPIP
ncbi:hypothetical protein CEUSTIGMA_g12658.t1 [Chlamydomonas eustigma]|uniref:Uncharacterized protein n=1 Tax=Chlamydomonas eustigma TaxID=1157962 RepID=A0A250XQA4_9CHLO|nr:hypothetical protein CEUSTIGMA_g12658.t1 [Chlamydomonas eustigma]|eukprot:GAX85238.1 hypothetical protein CEUSTIGMA_g12658.t1 [Chlamydomonas eustigma]